MGVHHLANGHIEVIDIGSFFAIDFNGDEGLVHEFSDLEVLEGFFFHDVAPVACGVTDGEEDGFMIFLGLLEGILTPWVPIDGVMSMLEEVRAFFVSELIFKSHDILFFGF